MGFFSSIGRVVTNAKRAVCRGVGKVIEKVGEITGNINIEIKGFQIQCDNPVLEKQVDLNDADTSIQDTINVHKLCEDTRIQAAYQAKKYEDELVDKLEEDIASFSDALAEVFPEEVLIELNYGLEKSFEDDIHNTVSDYVAVHISQDSEKFVSILNMSDDIREEKTDEYVKTVINGAMKELEKKCAQKRISIYRKMYDDLEAYFSSERKILEETQKNIEELKQHQNDMKYYEEQAVNTVIDVSHMESIRTLTYGDI